MMIHPILHAINYHLYTQNIRLYTCDIPGEFKYEAKKFIHFFAYARPGEPDDSIEISSYARNSYSSQVIHHYIPIADPDLLNKITDHLQKLELPTKNP